MKFSIERKLLLDVLSVGGSMSGKSKVLPILDSCKVVISNGRLIISSYDGENAVLKCCSVIEHDVDMSFCVNCSDFMKSVKSVKDAVLDFVFVENANILSINHLRGFMELPYESSDEFPTIDNVTDGVSIHLECSVLWNWLNRARNFVAVDTLRPILCGVNFYVSGSEYGVCASDGTVMFNDYSEFTDSTIGNINAVIPSSSLATVLSAINGSDYVTIKINERNISFSTTDSKVVCRRPEGVYPNFKAVLPKSHSVDVRLPRTDLLDAVNRAKMFANSGKHLCILETMVGELAIAAEDLDFSKKSVDKCVASLSGSIRIGAKSELLSMCLSVMDDESIVIEMSEPSRPIIFKEVACPNQTILLMPMLLC